MNTNPMNTNVNFQAKKPSKKIRGIEVDEDNYVKEMVEHEVELPADFYGDEFEARHDEKIPIKFIEESECKIHWQDTAWQDLNGKIEISVNPGEETDLPTSKKLVLPTRFYCYVTNLTSLQNYVDFAISHLDPASYPTSNAKQFVISAIYVILKCNIVSTNRKDVTYSQTPGKFEWTVNKVDKDMLMFAYMVIIQMKLNLYKTNHHIGADRIALPDKITKMAKALDFDMESSTLKGMLHQAGHWADTARVWYTCGLNNIKFTYGGKKAGNFKPSPQVIIRFKGLPASYARLTFIRSALEYLQENEFLRYIITPVMIQQFSAAYQHVCSNLVGFHPLANEFASIPEDPISMVQFEKMAVRLHMMLTCFFPGIGLLRSKCVPTPVSKSKWYDPRLADQMKSFRNSVEKQDAQNLVELVEAVTKPIIVDNKATAAYQQEITTCFAETSKAMSSAGNLNNGTRIKKIGEKKSSKKQVEEVNKEMSKVTISKDKVYKATDKTQLDGVSGKRKSHEGTKRGSSSKKIM